MGLDVGLFGAKNLQGAVDGESLNDIHKLAAAVIATAGITFRIFIREHGALGSQDRGTGVVFGSNHLQPLLLAAAFALDRLPNLSIRLFEHVYWPILPKLRDRKSVV